MTDDTLEAAVDLWCTDEAAATEQYGHISFWNTSGVSSFKGLMSPSYTGGQNINNVRPHMLTCNPPIEQWATDAVTSLESTFYYNTAFNRDISGFTTDAVVSMKRTFNYATAFNYDLSPWATGTVTTTERMFHNAEAFEQVLCWQLGEDVVDAYM